MKILTLNTWQERENWERRWEVVFTEIEKQRPEILAFQEVFNSSWAERVRKRTGYSTCIASGAEGGLVLLSSFPAARQEVVRLSPSSLEQYQRYVLSAEFRVGKDRLFTYNTHLSWKPEDGTTRFKQAEEILEIIQKKSPHGNCFLAGDLNSVRDSREIARLIKKGDFRDLYAEAHPGEEGFTWDNRNPYTAGSDVKLPDRRIDFILARRGGTLLKDLARCDLLFDRPDTEGVWASDHSGLLAEFHSPD